MLQLSTSIFCLHQVVQKKDSHDYRCLFRVCFIPRDPGDLLQDDPSAFEYFFLQVREAPFYGHALFISETFALNYFAIRLWSFLCVCTENKTLYPLYAECALKFFENIAKVALKSTCSPSLYLHGLILITRCSHSLVLLLYKAVTYLL